MRTTSAKHSETVMNRDADAVIISCEERSVLSSFLSEAEKTPLPLHLRIAPSDVREQVTVHLTHDEARSLADALSRMLDYAASPERYKSLFEG